jgi:hypothetical protein
MPKFLTAKNMIAKVGRVYTPTWNGYTDLSAASVTTAMTAIATALSNLETALFYTYIDPTVLANATQVNLLTPFTSLLTSASTQQVCAKLVQMASTLPGEVLLINGYRSRQLIAQFYLSVRAKVFVLSSDSSGHGHPRMDVVLGIALATRFYQLAKLPIILFNSNKPFELPRRSAFVRGLQVHMQRMITITGVPASNFTVSCW